MRTIGARALAVCVDVSTSLEVQAMLCRKLQTTGKTIILVSNAGV